MATSTADYEYVALEPIFYDGVRAFNAGDPVPADHVDDHELEVGVQVARRDTAKAEAVSVPPAKNASKDDWAAFARARGAQDDEIEASTRDELADKYGV